MPGGRCSRMKSGLTECSWGLHASVPLSVFAKNIDAIRDRGSFRISLNVSGRPGSSGARNGIPNLFAALSVAWIALFVKRILFQILFRAAGMMRGPVNKILWNPALRKTPRNGRSGRHGFGHACRSWGIPGIWRIGVFYSEFRNAKSACLSLRLSSRKRFLTCSASPP
jgi:hypothetical protein